MEKKYLKPNIKYIFISGGVISGLGKGTFSGALSALLQGAGLKVSPIKADMYLNIDAGTMNPLEHGETFVTSDGLECDQDIGTYERFSHQELSRKNYFTAGQIYQSVLNKERQLKYNGACVEAFPHIPLEIINFINRFDKNTDIALVEFGGTVGEYQNEAFFEAARMMATENPDNVCFIHVGYVLKPDSLGELKSKPMQMSIKALNHLGIWPDLVVARAQNNIDAPRIKKIAQAAGLQPKCVFSAPNVTSIYMLPFLLKQQDILIPIFEKLKMSPRRCDIQKWSKLYQVIKKPKNKITIAIAGKYYASGNYNLEDSYISVLEAIKHAGWHFDIEPQIIWLDTDKIDNDPKTIKRLKQVDAIIVPQGWGKRGGESKIKTIQFAREHKIPYLGLCYGMQMASIEFARNVAKIKNATSEEIDSETKTPIIHIMSEQKKHLEKKQYGGTIRLGAWPCKIQKNTILERLYKQFKKTSFTQIVQERHRHRYEFNNKYRTKLQKYGLIISGTSPDDKLVEAIELSQDLHPFFIATQYHPELISKPFEPHPLFLGLITAATKYQNQK